MCLFLDSAICYGLDVWEESTDKQKTAMSREIEKEHSGAFCDVIKVDNGPEPPSRPLLYQIEQLLVKAECKHGQDKDGVEMAPERILAFMSFGNNVAIIDPQSPPLPNEMSETECGDLAVACNNVPIIQPMAVAKANRRLHESIVRECTRHLDSGYFPRILTIGGDHSIAMGSISGITCVLGNMLKRMPGYSSFTSPDPVVFWIDAHTDINTPRTTLSGKLHGCPVSLLVGLDKDAWRELTAFDWTFEKLQELDRGSFVCSHKLVYIGTRDVDPPEREILDRENILEYSMDRVKERRENITGMVEEALRQVDPTGTHPIHISFDIDSLDPTIAASTGTPVPGGLMLDEGVAIIATLKNTGRLVSMDLVEVNPMIGTEEQVQCTLVAASALIKTFSGMN